MYSRISIHVETDDTQSVICMYLDDTESIVHLDMCRFTRYKKCHEFRHISYLSADTKSIVQKRYLSLRKALCQEPVFSSISRASKKIMTPTATSGRSCAVARRLDSQEAATERLKIVRDPLGCGTVPSAMMSIVFGQCF